MTTTPKFTPGPWVLGTHPANHRLNIIKPVMFGSRVTVLPECEGGHVSIKNIADAHLIAAAPDLLEALEELYDIGSDTGMDWDWDCMKKARSAIAKARGEV